MVSQHDKTTVIAELEALKDRLEESLRGLAGRTEHIPMHDVVAGLLHRVREQQGEIESLRTQLADCLGRHRLGPV